MFLCLHPDNPHVFLFQGRPCVLVTAGEHYGAVINRHFDTERYLDMLRRHGFNLTRTFLFYREQGSSVSGLEDKGDGGFGEMGEQNTLAPDADHYVAPWLRSQTPGAFDGGNRFDLTKPNPAYYERLLSFVRAAAARGIAVEVVLFSQYYSNGSGSPWQVSPLNVRNNINGVGDIAYYEATSLRDAGTIRVEEELVTRVVQTLRHEPNVYYEICNEPNPLEQDPHVPYPEIAAWQNHFVRWIADLERDGLQRHMIAVNDPNDDYDLELVSVLTFHYEEWVQRALSRYADGGKALAFDETLTGIVAWNREMNFDARRREAWRSLMQGFGVYDYLDFTIATEDPEGVGLVRYPFDQAYDGTTMRRYLQALMAFFDALPLADMRPRPEAERTQALVSRVYVMGSADVWAAYVEGNALKWLRLSLPAGRFGVRWYDPHTGAWTAGGELPGGEVALSVPAYEQDIAVRFDRLTSDRDNSPSGKAN